MGGWTNLLVGLVALLTAPPGLASTYVPGQARTDGLYVPPHFREASGKRHAVEAWYDALPRKGATLDEHKLPPPPPAAPAQPAAPSRHL